jgi:hypothetical protein
MAENLDILNAAVSHLTRAALLAARFSGRVRKRSIAGIFPEGVQSGFGRYEAVPRPPDRHSLVHKQRVHVNTRAMQSFTLQSRSNAPMSAFPIVTFVRRRSFPP